MKNINHILIGFAFSPNLKANLCEAIRLANMFDATLVCVHVGEKTSEKEVQLERLMAEAPEPKNAPNIVWQQGDPVHVILNTCKEQQIDLLILGAKQQENLYRYYVGSIARKLTRKAPCSVLLLIKPSIERVPTKQIVVNGLQGEATEEIIKTSYLMARQLDCKRMTVVEEISQKDISIKVEDDEALRKTSMEKERIKQREDHRIKTILKDLKCNDVNVKVQPIFGRRGYSIGHYAKVVHADLLIMDGPKKTGLWDRIFPHDIEYILTSLPTDVLIVK